MPRDPFKKIMEKRAMRKAPTIPVPLICPHCGTPIKGVKVLIPHVVIEYPKSQIELLEDARKARQTGKFIN